jgi:hypothetical protein
MSTMTSPPTGGRAADVPAADVASAESRSDVARVVERMLVDLRAHPTAWENPSLERFLEALAACLVDGVGAVHEDGAGAPTWTLLAEVLVAASGYE